MPFNELTQKHLNNLKNKIIQIMDSKDMNDTGGTKASLEIRGNELLGNEPIYYLDQGRRPGGYPPPDIMLKWVESKLKLQDTEAKQVAFLISRKIAEDGSIIYNDKSQGLQLDDLIENTLDELYKELPLATEVEILKFFNENEIKM